MDGYIRANGKDVFWGNSKASGPHATMVFNSPETGVVLVIQYGFTKLK